MSIEINFVELYTSKIFGNGKDSSKGSNFDLDTDLSTLNSKLVNETINSCSNIVDSSVSKTVNCGSNLSTPQINEEYDQRKNVKKKLDEQIADVRKQLHENCNSFKSNNELLHYHNKTPPTNPTPWAKGTTLIAGDSMLHEIGRPQYYALNSVCNNDCKRKSDTAGPKHLLEIKHASSPTDFEDAGNQMNTLHETRIKNANRLIIGHLNVKSLRNKFEMLEELIKDKIDIF